MTDLVELKLLVATHERPFVLIGRDFEVAAVNQAYDGAFNRAGAELVGQKCHQVLHHREHPCSEMGEAGNTGATDVGSRRRWGSASARSIEDSRSTR